MMAVDDSDNPASGLPRSRRSRAATIARRRQPQLLCNLNL